MKAKEYMSRFDNVFLEDIRRESMLPEREGVNGSFVTISSGILSEILREVFVLVEKRGVQLDSGVLSVIREQRDKWRAVCHLIQKKYGDSFLDESVFETAFASLYPDIYAGIRKDFWR